MAFALKSKSQGKTQGAEKPAPKRKFAHGQRSADSRSGFEMPVFQPPTAALPGTPVIQTKLKTGGPTHPSQDGVLQRKCGCGGSLGRLDDCAECGDKEKLGLQTKLKINEPGDIYEQEADRIANEVMASPARPDFSGAPLRIQRFSGQSNGRMNAAPASVDQALTSPGRPLETALRQDMEQRFRHDFSHVRVHVDDRAAGVARSVGARAFTFGKHMAFGAGEYTPGTREGKRLLAHELVHVIQQHRSGNSISHTIQRDKEKKSKEAGSQVIIIANGYPGFDSVKSEVAAAQNDIWLPSTTDFSKTASDTQKDFFGASIADEFFGALQSVKGKIKRVVFIGHGHSAGLGLSGKPMNWFEKGLDQSDLTRWQGSIDSDIKSKFVKGATLDIYACNVAAGGDFIKALAKSLGICVRGFSRAVFWCLGFKGDTVTSRGRIANSRVRAGCSNKKWFTGVNKLVPPDKVCP